MDLKSYKLVEEKFDREIREFLIKQFNFAKSLGLSMEEAHSYYQEEFGKWGRAFKKVIDLLKGKDEKDKDDLLNNI